MKLFSKIFLDNEDDYVFGPGRLELLREIRRLGSLRQAALALEMSYRWAWGRIKDTEKAFGTLLLENVSGRGGKAKELTKEAYELMDWADEVDKKVYTVLREAEKNMPDFLHQPKKGKTPKEGDPEG